jgi:putative protease
LKRIELLAPAKNYDFGKAAIDYGADAVYIGANNFSARSAAGNSVSEIAKLVNYAHKYYAKVYVALNTIIYDEELDPAQKLINQLYDIGTDALIIQDMSILEMDLPPITLHASTQTNNYDLEKIKFLDKIGFERIILARELSLNQIKKIKSETNTELEVFIHGALCVSLSGQCYLSCAMNGRSANRGECAQPCRMKYSLIDSDDKTILNEAYLLSLKDMNRSGSLKSLIGRLKDINYVKNVTAFYRQELDKIIFSDASLSRASSGKTNLYFMPDLAKSFNRGFTDYFLYKREEDISSTYTPKSMGEYIGNAIKVTDSFFEIKYADNKLKLANGDGICFFDKNSNLTGLNINRVEKTKVFTRETTKLFKNTKIFRNYNHEFSKLLKQDPVERKINLKIIVNHIETGLKVLCTDEDNNFCELEFKISKEPAQNRETALKNITKQFSKTGNSIFKVSEVTLDLPQLYFIPVKELNQMRRTFLEEIETLRLKNYQRPVQKILNNKIKYPANKLNFRANISNKLAKDFYKKHGIKERSNAFEIDRDIPGKELMTTKYCLKYQAGLCHKKKTKTSNSFKEPLYLKDIKNKKYRVEFDCAECFMGIFEE